MQTRTEDGTLVGPARLLEMLEFRYGAFRVIAHAALEFVGQDVDFAPPMDRDTAEAIIEFGDDLKQAYVAAVEWMEQCGATGGPAEGVAEADADAPDEHP